MWMSMGMIIWGMRKRRCSIEVVELYLCALLSDLVVACL